jgi:hypothetical protein
MWQRHHETDRQPNQQKVTQKHPAERVVSAD